MSISTQHVTQVSEAVVGAWTLSELGYAISMLPVVRFEELCRGQVDCGACQHYRECSNLDVLSMSLDHYDRIAHAPLALPPAPAPADLADVYEDKYGDLSSDADDPCTVCQASGVQCILIDPTTICLAGRC